MTMLNDDFDASFTTAHPVTDRRLRRLCFKLDACGGSEEYIAVIRKIIRTRHPQAIEVLAGLLDSPGAVGHAAAEGLVSFGPAAIPEMRRVLSESLDSDARHQAIFVLEELGAEHGSLEGGSPAALVAGEAA
jgi:hypothetical protein